MIVTIWRHGTAEEGVNDRLRELTLAGRTDVSFGCGQFLQACASRNIAPASTILHSPWVRTTQTAEIIAAAFNPVPLFSESALRPGSDLAEVDDVIADYDREGTLQHLVLVSHQPLVSRLVDHYLAEPGRVPPLPPGGLATLSFDVAQPACATLVFWAFPPGYEVGV